MRLQRTAVETCRTEVFKNKKKSSFACAHRQSPVVVRVRLVVEVPVAVVEIDVGRGGTLVPLLWRAFACFA